MFKGRSARRKQVANLSKSQDHNVRLLVEASSIAARKRGLRDLSAVLKLLAINPEKAKSIRKIMTTTIRKPVRSSPEETLAFVLDQGLSKEQYTAFREETMKRNVNIFPPYKEVAGKKSFVVQIILRLATP